MILENFNLGVIYLWRLQILRFVNPENRDFNTLKEFMF